MTAVRLASGSTLPVVYTPRFIMAALNQPAPPRSRWWSLSVASLATLIVTADSGQLSIALPLIIKGLNADLALASWIALVYALITASLYLPAADCRTFSAWADYFSRVLLCTRAVRCSRAY